MTRKAPFSVWSRRAVDPALSEMVRSSHAGEDGVIRGIGRVPVCSVAGDQGRGVADVVEAGSGIVGQVGVDVDGSDLVRAEAFAEQGGGVAGAGTDLQGVVASVDFPDPRVVWDVNR